MQKWLLAIAVLSAGCQSGEPRSAAPPRAANYASTLSPGTSTRPSNAAAAVAEPTLPPVAIEPPAQTPGTPAPAFESIERFDVVTIPLDRVRPIGSLFAASSRATQMPPPAARFLIRRTTRPMNVELSVEIAQRPAGSFTMSRDAAAALAKSLNDPVSANAVSSDIYLGEATMRREPGSDVLYISTNSAETWVSRARFLDALNQALAAMNASR